MQSIWIRAAGVYDRLLKLLLPLDGLASLGLRLYLAPVFWMAGTTKLHSFSDAVAWFGNAEWGLPFANAGVLEAPEKLERVRAVLQEHGNDEWLTSSGKLVVPNNGIEFAATYFLMLLALFYLGGGRFFSVDYWLKRCLPAVSPASTSSRV